MSAPRTAAALLLLLGACGSLDNDPLTRGVVMRLAGAMGLQVEEGFYTLYDVYNADEAFLTGTAAEGGQGAARVHR